MSKLAVQLRLKPTPGQFSAKCNLPGEWELPPAELQDAWLAILAAPIPYSQGAEAIEVYRAEKTRLEEALAPWGFDPKRREHGRYLPCAFSTEDATLFDAHMLDVHSQKPIKGYGDTAEYKALHRLWRGPKLAEDGKPFEPAGLEPGATVTWSQLVETGETYFDGELGRRVEQRKTVERSGQVWSAAPGPRSAWVVPFEPLEGERCVLLALDRDGEAYHRETWTVRDAERAA